MSKTIPPLQDVMFIEDPDALKALAVPIRLDIIKALEHPATVKEVAAKLDMPPTKLYYHFKQLEQHQIIRVVDTNIVSGIIEKQYQVTASRYQMSETLVRDSTQGEASLDAILATIFEVTRNEVRQSIQAQLLDPAADKSKKKAMLSHTAFHLTAEQFQEFYGRMEQLIEEMITASEAGSEEPDRLSFGFTIALYPVIKPNSEI